jgi:hypothetical protein
VLVPIDWADSLDLKSIQIPQDRQHYSDFPVLAKLILIIIYFCANEAIWVTKSFYFQKSTYCRSS